MPCSVCREPGHNARTCKPSLFYDANENTEFYEFMSTLANSDDFEEDAFYNNNGFMNTLELTDSCMTTHDLVQECMICYEHVTNEKVSLKCGHSYCVDCFVKHMRINNTCAYCRTEVCEPPPSNKKQMTTETRHALIHRSIEDYNDTINEDFITQMRASLTAQMSQNESQVTRRSAAIMNEMCVRAMSSVDMTFASWVVGLQSSNSISDWYEM